MASVAALESALVEGRSPTEAVLAVVKKFNISTSTAWADYKVVRRRWANARERASLNPEASFGEALRRMDTLMRLAANGGDFKTALECERDRRGLLGIAAPETAQAGRATSTTDLSKYRNDPVGYARDILKAEPTPDQQAIAKALLEPPYRVMVKSGHNIGKSWLAAWITNWWFDTRNPSWGVTSAPDFRSVSDILWTEIRLQRQRAGIAGCMAPSAPAMGDGPEHRAKGYTARKGESFQGRHRAAMLFVFDEAEGVDPVFWQTADTMFHADGTHAFLAILNPTTTTSQSYVEENAVGSDGKPKWKVFSLSALNHPNIKTALENREREAKGEPLQPIPVPSAVSLHQVEGWLNDWFEPVRSGEQNPEFDIEFPPASGQWWKPDPDGEARVLGRRPSAGTYGVWTEGMWKRACENPQTPPVGELPEIGCDVARFGNDRTEIHVRCGPVSLQHEDYGGWDTVRVADRLMTLAKELAAWQNSQQPFGQWQDSRRPPQAEPVKATEIKIKVDDTGVGGGVTDILRANGFNVIAVNAGESAPQNDKYPLVRDQLWFETRNRAKAGQLDLSRLGAKMLARLQVQALAPIWWPTTDQRRQVESKSDVKERLKRSPDGMDALNLAYFEPGSGELPTVIQAGHATGQQRQRR